MVALSLKIGVGNVVKTMQFEPSTMVYDACRIIRERVPEAQLGQRESHTHTTHTRAGAAVRAESCLVTQTSAAALPVVTCPLKLLSCFLHQLFWPQVRTRWQRCSRQRAQQQPSAAESGLRSLSMQAYQQ